jgi:hypothetical protein
LPAPSTLRPNASAASPARNWLRWLWATPAVFALVYGLIVLAEFRPLIGQIYLNSDTAAAPVLAHLAGEAGAGAQIVLGNHPYYEEYLFLRLTSGIPAYRQVWDVVPMLWSLLGLALLGWSALRAFGRFAALLVVSAALCVGTFGRLVFLTFDFHGLTAVHTIVVGAVLVWLTPRAAALSWWRILALAVALGLIGVLPEASDVLFRFWALVPLFVTGLAVAWRGRGPERARMATFAITAAVVSLVGGALVAHALSANGVTAVPFAYTFVPAASILNNIVLTFESYMYFGGGYFFGWPTGFNGSLVFASGVLILAAIVLVLAELRRRAALAAPRESAGGADVGPRFVYVVFWATCLVSTSVAFFATSAPVDVNGSRYLVAGYIAIGALLPLLAFRSQGWRIAVTAGVCVFAFSGIYQVATMSFAVSPPTSSAQEANQLAAYAKSEHVAIGYGPYWDAVQLTWATRFGVQIYPVDECAPATHGLCQFPTVHISTWYTSRPHARSLLIVDPAQLAPTVTGVDATFGRPIASTTIGGMSVFVFPYNLNTKLLG